jgi:hypothetical protein
VNVNFSIVPLSLVSVGNHTILVNATLENSSTIYAVVTLTLDVRENRTYTETINTTANQTTTVNAANETDTIIDLVTGENVTDADINITQESDNPTNASLGEAETGKYININASENLKSNITWIIIKVYYTEEELAAAGITNESTLSMYWYNESSGQWVKLVENMTDENGSIWVYGIGVNTSRPFPHYVWANLSHLSLFALSGKKANGYSCSLGSECESGNCASDYDLEGKWCAPAGSCVHSTTSTCNSTCYGYANGATLCSDSYTKQTCSSGTWSSTTCNYGCSNGECSSAPSAPSAPSVGAPTRALSILLSQSVIGINQGESGIVKAIVNNTGKRTETSVSVSVSGLDGLSAKVTPSDVDLEVGESREYVITIYVPETFETGDYSLTIKAESQKTSVSTLLTVKVKEKAVKPPPVVVNETQAQEAIMQADAMIEGVENQISHYEELGWDVGEAKSKLLEAKDLNQQAKAAFESKNYKQAKDLADQASDFADRALDLITYQPTPPPMNYWLLVGIIILIIVLVIGNILIRKKQKK